VRELINPIFWVKVVLLALALVVGIQFSKATSQVDSAGASSGLRLGAVLIIVLWLAIMAAGRWIAYAPV
jgi:protein-S-isoprenylcysteine O-methyltransferase Ste14